MDCLILGGGIMGLLCARELSKYGLQVTVLERGQIGREASWAGGGILSPLYPWRQPEAIEQLAQASGKLYAALAEELRERTGIDPEWQQCGMLWLAIEDFERAQRWCLSRGIDFEALGPEDIEKRGLQRTTVSDAKSLWLPGICQIRNPKLLKALKRDLILRGVILRENTPVTGWRISSSQAVSVMTPGEEMKADVFVVTAGAWSSMWQLALWQPRIRPIKGQMLMIKAVPGCLDTIVQRKEHYLIPRRDGRILVGSTVEEAGFDKRPTEEAYQELYRFAVETLPSLTRFQVELHWAGLRPAAPGGIPCIGRHPQLENLYYNCGHFRNGVTMGPAAARLLADLILGRAPDLDPSHYLPGRYR